MGLRRHMRLLPLLVFPLSCAPAETCDLDATAAEIGGEGAVPCGAAGGEADAEGWGCALDAWGAGTPFVLRYTSQGTDSTLERAVVYDGDTVWLLTQDQYGQGPWDVDGYECVDPVVEADTAAGHDVLGCGSLAPEGNHFQVCGEICTDCGDPDPLPFPGE